MRTAAGGTCPTTRMTCATSAVVRALLVAGGALALVAALAHVPVAAAETEAPDEPSVEVSADTVAEPTTGPSAESSPEQPADPSAGATATSWPVGPPAPQKQAAAVAAWIEAEGLVMVGSRIGAEVTTADPVDVRTWSTGVLDATDLSAPTEPTDVWAAVASTDAGPVAVLLVDAGGDRPTGVVVDDPQLAGALAELPSGTVVLREAAPRVPGTPPSVTNAPATPAPGVSGPADPTPSPADDGAGTTSGPATDATAPGTAVVVAGTTSPAGDGSADAGATRATGAPGAAAALPPLDAPPSDDAWYALNGNVVTALDKQAAAGLAGPVGLDVYAQVLHDRIHGAVETEEPETPSSRRRRPDAGIIYTGLGVLVIGTLIVTTTFVHERRVLAPLREESDGADGGRGPGRKPGDGEGPTA